MTALLLVPTGRNGPVPAILWLHSSTPDKTQVIIPGTNGGAESLGETFVRAATPCCHPTRTGMATAGTGPSGRAETEPVRARGPVQAQLVARAHAVGNVRPRRSSCARLPLRPSGGGFDSDRRNRNEHGQHAPWWLAAVDERVAVVAAVACLTRYQNLIAHGELRQHGVYYFVNGLLRHFDSEGVLALIAPRPLLALTGELDSGSPADGVRVLERAVGGTYQALGAGDHFRSVLYPDVGHDYTPEMRTEMLAWFARWLRPAAVTSAVRRELIRTSAGDRPRGRRSRG